MVVPDCYGTIWEVIPDTEHDVSEHGNQLVYGHAHIQSHLSRLREWLHFHLEHANRTCCWALIYIYMSPAVVFGLIKKMEA